MPMTSLQARTLRVSVLLFNDVEVLDFAGPYEVFTTASRVQQRLHPQAPPQFEVACVSRNGQPIQARAGLRVVPEHSYATAPQCDVLIVPGGLVDAAMACPKTLRWIAQTAGAAQITASVCTGAFLLAASGVLRTHEVTTHWEDAADLRKQFPALTVTEGPRWVDQDSIVTSAGISAGIDMCLHLLQRLAGTALAERTARQMDYRWTTNDCG
jgi:transcriptional regulator GlxA family with amidase domain